MTAVLIECLLKRQGGTVVDLPGETYHFKPASGVFLHPHVALVEDREHVACFLRVPEAYALADEHALPVAPKPAPLPATDEFAHLSDGAIADQFTQAYGSKPLKGFTRELMITALRAAPAQTPGTPKAPTKGKATKAAKEALDPNGKPATGTAPAPQTEPTEYDSMADDDVLSQYIVLFGAEPAADMDRDAMIEALKAMPKE